MSDAIQDPSDEAISKPDLLRKGLEEEVYTGTWDGHVVGLSHRIAADLPGFATEPDSRNVEYTTTPYRDYQVLLDRLMAKRCRLRRYLQEIGDYTLVPGGSLSLERSDEFYLSNHDNPYYRYIADTYGVRVVTASTHINVGVEDPASLLRACRVLRCEAAAFLALTASSPFHRGQVTGHHSTRWRVFPETPSPVPPFESHAEFIDWVETKIHAKEMFNPRHLWLSVRPNGPASPYKLSRVELRICDRIGRPRLLAGVTALMEARIWQILDNPELDPMGHMSRQDFLRLAHDNDMAAATSSLEADFVDWRTGRSETMRVWLERYLEAARETARAHGFAEQLDAIDEVLEHGNLAQIWLERHRRGATPMQVIARSISELATIDREYDPGCPEPLLAAGTAGGP